MKKKFIAAVCVMAVLLAGCSANNSSNTSSTTASATTTAVDTAADLVSKAETVEIEQMNVVETKSDADIVLGSSVTSAADGVEINGSVVTITKAGSYSVSGVLEDGQIVVDADGDVELTLCGVGITNSSGPAIYAKNGDLTLVLDDGSVNVLADGAEYSVSDDNNPNAAIFTQDDLTVTGAGSLSVTGSYKNGINCKDALAIESGAVYVASADNGIIGKESVTVTGGTVTVNAGGDGIKSTSSDGADLGWVKISGGTLNITCGEDGITAETDLDVSGGEINIVSGGGSENGPEHTESFGFFEQETDASSDEVSTKGLKGGSSVTISGGTISIDSADDSVHSNGTITVNGCTMTLASGDDGIHADTKLVINGGRINIIESYEGLESAIIEINDGDIDIRSSDDGINVAGDNDSSGFGGFGGNANLDNGQYLKISGGDIYVNADGDGLDMNGSGSIEGGTVIVEGPTNDGNGALDYDGTFVVNGGTFITSGSSGMAMTPSSDSALNTISLTQSISAGSTVSVKDSSGAEIISCTTTKTAANVTFTTDKIVTGETYTLYVDGTEAGSVTVSGTLSYIGSSGGGNGGFGGGPGGGPGGGRPNDNDGGTPPEMPNGQ